VNLESKKQKRENGAEEKTQEKKKVKNFQSLVRLSTHICKRSNKFQKNDK
jgi:hypothetical protein